MFYLDTLKGVSLGVARTVFSGELRGRVQAISAHKDVRVECSMPTRERACLWAWLELCSLMEDAGCTRTISAQKKIRVCSVSIFEMV